MRRSLSIAALALLTGGALAQNLVVNGSFENHHVETIGSGTASSNIDAPDNWTIGLAADGDYDISDFEGANVNITPYDGNWMMGFGAFGTLTKDENLDNITQSIATTAGTQYTLTYHLYDNGGSYFFTSFGGQEVSGSRLANTAGNSAWTTYQFTLTGTGGAEDLEFHGGSPVNLLYLDAVTLTANAAPEPLTLLALGLGIGAVLIKRNRA